MTAARPFRAVHVHHHPPVSCHRNCARVFRLLHAAPQVAAQFPMVAVAPSHAVRARVSPLVTFATPTTCASVNQPPVCRWELRVVPFLTVALVHFRVALARLVKRAPTTFASMPHAYQLHRALLKAELVAPSAPAATLCRAVHVRHPARAPATVLVFAHRQHHAPLRVVPVARCSTAASTRFAAPALVVRTFNASTALASAYRLPHALAVV